MNSLYKIVTVLAAIAMIGSTGASLQQQAFAQGIIVYDREQFTKLTDDFERAVLDAAAIDPPEPDKIQSLLDQYNSDVMKVFGLPLIKGDPLGEADPPTEADPPGELEPPDPDLEPPDPDKS